MTDLEQIIIGKLESLDGKLDKALESVSRYEETGRQQKEDIEEVKADLEPIKAHVQQVIGIGKFLGLITTVMSLAGAVYALGVFK